MNAPHPLPRRTLGAAAALCCLLVAPAARADSTDYGVLATGWTQVGAPNTAVQVQPQGNSVILSTAAAAPASTQGPQLPPGAPPLCVSLGTQPLWARAVAGQALVKTVTVGSCGGGGGGSGGSTTVNAFPADVANTGTLAAGTANATYAVALANGEGVVGLSLSGLAASGATLVAEGSGDGGSTWTALTPVAAGSGLLVPSLTADGIVRLNTGGLTNVRLRVTTVGSGSITVASLASTQNPLAMLSAPLPAGGNTIGSVGQAGSTGLDGSANAPAIPVVGNGFGSSGPYANYVLVRTVPAAAGRFNVDVENTSGAPIVIVRDSGTASAGAAPVNASLIPLGPGGAAGQQGGSWSSTTFKGRLQVYAPSASAFVSVFAD